MSQPLSDWAKKLADEMQAWLQEPDPVKKAAMKEAWRQRLFASAKPPRPQPAGAPTVVKR